MPRNLKVINLHTFFFLSFLFFLVNFPKVYVQYKAMMKVTPFALNRTDTIYSNALSKRSDRHSSAFTIHKKHRGVHMFMADSMHFEA
jgi:hypothetical protein